MKTLFKINLVKTSLSITLALATSFLIGCQQEQSVTTVNNANTGNTIATKRLTATDLPHYLNRDIQDEVFYFVMPDRFHNGDTTNDNGSKTKPISSGGFDKTNKGMFHGGDIKGLQDKLPYLKELGISAIWLTPILRNQAMQDNSAGYHGYWVLDFTEIDPHFGTNENLKNFIAAAHQENMKVFFDIITNHTADVIKFEECHGKDGLQWLVAETGCVYKSLAQKAAGDTYTPVIPKGLDNVKSPEWLNKIEYYHNQGDTTFEGENSLYGDFAGLDDLDTDNPEVVANMIDTFKDFVSEFKPDGFRIDTVKHVNIEFWSDFSPAIVNHAKSIGIPQFFMFGEVYDANSKVLSQYTTKGNMQSVLDFGFQSMVTDTLIKQTGTDVIDAWSKADSDYLDHDSNANQLLNFIGNHDMGRFAYMVKSSPFDYSQEQQIKRNILAHAMMYFMRGVPIIYYGDEQGFVGDGGDQDSRQDMMPSLVESYNDDNLLATNASTADDNFDQNHPFYRAFAEMASIYYQEPVLRYGQQATLYQQSTPGLYVFSRTISGENNQQVIIAFNTSNEKKTISLTNAIADVELLYSSSLNEVSLHLKDSQATINLPPLDYAIWRVK
ncbi:alpha-amylase family glycosyl hydrolase [Thalassotalea profundi]|uniref:Alpha-amylase n=1 Tax=Thalassotalea profundi TaxID=2036687 RepID=A0ABQ3IBQ2_9GAMM|nr:alpha-amylase family glycosyl hydrolase [Thalassotalea profundi]GHE78062.1 alpha-amylase [Thalassotalea profundi]